MKNFTAALTKLSQTNSQNLALISDDVAYTYAQLDEAVWKLATYMVASGVSKGDVICLRFADDFLLALAYLAVGRIGGTGHVLPRGASLVQQEIMARRVNSRMCLNGLDGGAQFDVNIPFSLEILQGLSVIDHNVMDNDPVFPWLIITGSGTTGEPKLIPISQISLSQQFEMYASVLKPGPTDRVASLLSMELGPGYWQMLTSIFSGAAFCVLDKGGIQVGPWCMARGITILGTVSGQLESLLHVAPGMLSNLRAIVPVGAPVSDSLRCRVQERLGDVLYIMYGATEVGAICIATPQDVKSTPGTVGRALPGMRVEVVSDDDVPLPANQPGHVRITSEIACSTHYIGQEDYSKRIFRDGSIYPGDMGKLMSDGQLIHLGRSDDMLILNGLNIFPSEIETVLLAHPSIEDAVVRPARHPIFQEIPIAAICLRDGTIECESELLQYARERLGARAPRRIFVLSEVPRTVQGKLDRKALADILRRDFEIEMS